MPKLVSLSARTSVTAEATEVVPVTLITIDHPTMNEPVRLSTDPTERLSVEPLRYGTRHRGDLYYYALVSVPLPEQGQDAADTVTLVVDIVTPGMAGLTSLSTFPATVDLVQVMSDRPDDIEIAWLDLETRSAEVSTDQDQISIEIGRIAYLDEPTQRHRMTADRFPGLHRR